MFRARPWIVSTLVLLVAGCSSPSEKARKKYEFLQANGGTLGEVCDAGREMIAAQADAQDKGRPEDRAMVDVSCMTAEMQGRNMPANQADAAYTMAPDDMDVPTGSATQSPPIDTPHTAPSIEMGGQQEEADQNGEIGRNTWQGE